MSLFWGGCDSDDCSEEIAELKTKLAAAEKRLAELEPHATKIWSTDEVLRILGNVGVNVKCGSCAEIAFTGATTNQHDCSRRHEDPEPIHGFFGLSYAHYLVLPRSVLQSMPVEWQRRVVQCIDELDDTIDWRPSDGVWWVTFKDRQGRFRPDPLNDYERGRRRLPRKS